MMTKLSDSLAGLLLKEPIPLTILTGFLGAGKTTLLNRILTSDHGRRVAVLVNDFGAVNIDAALVVGVEENIVSLANGCICCEIRDDLIESIDRLLNLDEIPEHIILEASGIADPAGIWSTFASSRHPEWLQLDGVLCVVDCEQVFAYLDEAPELLMLKSRQIGFSDLVILNKVDLVSKQVVDYVQSWIDTMMNRVRVVEACRCEVPIDILLGLSRNCAEADRGEPDRSFSRSNINTHRQQFATWTFETEKAVDETMLREMISRQLPASVYRCKGFIRLKGDYSSAKLLQTVGRRTELLPAPISLAKTPTKILAIGRHDINISELDEMFQSCLA